VPENYGPVAYEDAHCRVVALPYNGRRLSYFMSFNHKVLGNQDFTIDLNETNFAAQIAPARTFGFLKDLERLRANGLAMGGSLDNAVVLDDDRVLNARGYGFLMSLSVTRYSMLLGIFLWWACDRGPYCDGKVWPQCQCSFSEKTSHFD